MRAVACGWWAPRLLGRRCPKDALVAVCGIAQHGSLWGGRLCAPSSLVGACCALGPLHGFVGSPHSAWLLLPLSASGFSCCCPYSGAAGSPQAWLHLSDRTVS